MDRDWNIFVEKCLNSCINRNKERTDDKIYACYYEYDWVELTCNKLLQGVILSPLKSISLTQEEYLQGNKSDKDILENLFNDIQSES